MVSAIICKIARISPLWLETRLLNWNRELIKNKLKKKSKWKQNWLPWRQVMYKLPKPKKRKPVIPTEEQIILERIHNIRMELDDKIKMIKRNIRSRG